MAPRVSSETQLTRVERTWRFSCRARDHVIGPFIVCIEVMSSSPGLSAGERRERERGGAPDRWGRAVRRGAGVGVAGLLGPREERGGGEAGAGVAWAGYGPAEGGCFSFFFFCFLFLISIFYFYFFLFPFLLNQQLAK
jgi:hypothetical protein